MKVNKAFFGTKATPEIIIDKKALTELVSKSIKGKQAVTGVQKKLSVNLESSATERLTIVDYPAGYILKPQTEDYRALPESEDLVMDISKLAGVHTVPHGLVRLNDEYAYITKRIDRNVTKKIVEKYAMEDFCQLSEKSTAMKYRGSYERCVDIINKYSSISGADRVEFFLRILVSFVTGNSDMHLKNFSLIETEPGNRKFVLSPAYDLLPVSIVNPEDDEELALTLNGKKKNIQRKDFMVLAEKCNMPSMVAERMMNRTINLLPEFIKLTRQSEMPKDLQEKFIELMKERIERISK